MGSPKAAEEAGVTPIGAIAVRIAALTAIFALATSCATPRNAVALRWCSPPKPFVRAHQELPEIRIQQIAEHRIQAAYDRLGQHTLVALDPTSYAKFLDAGAGTPIGTHLYLARAGMMAPAGLSLSRLARHARMTSFAAYEGDSSGSLRIVSLITSKRQQRPTNIPVLVAAPSAIAEVSATCLGGR